MRFRTAIATLLLSLCRLAAGKAAFAHFMVGNTAGFTANDWEAEMKLAQAAAIDGFALNMAWDEDTTAAQVPHAFIAATRIDFKLIFSFDYAGNGPWPKADVIKLLDTWAKTNAYFKHEGSKPLVSTFEGPDQSEDWEDIKKQTNCFFMPSWSSLGAMRALQLKTADGLFNWAAWPTSTGVLTPMDTYTDASYIQYLRDSFGEDQARKRYMMPVSPWFYTNLPQYNKNWLWRADSLWHTRWQQVIDVDPEYVQIISWNDFGESHYIGPVRDSPPFSHPDAVDYVKDMPHDGWRKTIPAWIDLWKKGTTTVAKEELVMWHLLQPPRTCSDGGTTINTATHIQLEYSTASYGANNVFFDAVLTAPVDSINVVFDGQIEKAYFTHGPSKGAGVYHGSHFIDTYDREGAVTIQMFRGGKLVLSSSGKRIGGCGPSGIRNFNPWVGSASGGAVTAVTSSKMSDLTCTSGWGRGSIDSICRVTCGLGYCPLGACVCDSVGTLNNPPKADKPDGYTLGDPNYIGLCSYACTRGYCLPGSCSPEPKPIVEPAVSPFLPLVCREGRANDGGDRATREFCKFTCSYGHCPIAVCTCTSTGTLKEIQSDYSRTPGVSGMATKSVWDSDHPGRIAINNMCAFACPYGHCPIESCDRAGDSSSGTPPPYDFDGDDSTDMAACTGEYTTLASLVDDLDKIPAHCLLGHAVGVAQHRLREVTKRYEEILADGYDKYFEIYANHIAELGPSVLKQVLYDRGDRYFDCRVVEQITCCAGCNFKGLDCKHCRNTDDVCVGSQWGNGDLQSVWEPMSQPCPPQYQFRGIGDPKYASIYWTLRKDKEDAFYDDVASSVGVNKDVVTWADKVKINDEFNPGCGGNRPDDWACLRRNHWFDVPVVAGMTKADVFNPKDIFVKAMENTTRLMDELSIVRWEMATGAFEADLEEEDLVDAVMLPVFMLDESLKSMEEVVKMGTEIKEADEKALIIHILSAVFMLISAAGGPVAAAGRAALGRVLVLIGELGGTGLGLEGAVNDPSSIPFVLFGMVMSVSALRDVAKIHNAARLARSMPPKDLAMMSGALRTNMVDIASLTTRRTKARMCHIYK